MKSNYKMIPVHSLKVHELANMTPMQTDIQYNALVASIKDNGLFEPIITYRGKLIDGRHRLLAHKELNMEEIKAVSLPSDMSIEDIENNILDIYENRRHQTATQKAIFAYRNMLRMESKGIKTTIGSVAEKYGTTRNMVSRVKKLSGLAQPEIIDALFNGKKIDIGTTGRPLKSDSLYAIINYYKKKKQEELEKEIAIDTSGAFTDDEIASIQEMAKSIKSQFNIKQIDYLKNLL